jgi:hypothetical protein
MLPSLGEKPLEADEYPVFPRHAAQTVAINPVSSAALRANSEIKIDS